MRQSRAGLKFCLAFATKKKPWLLGSGKMAKLEKLIILIVLMGTFITAVILPAAKNAEINLASTKQPQTVTEGTTYYRDFILDNVLHTKKNGDIHYNLYVPKSYEKSKKKYALYVTLPGYQGLYFQGVAQNVMTENFGFEAMKYSSRMIILAPQLSDWGETSADQTIALVKYFLKNYRIDSSKVYISGYSGGGETLSLVLSKNPGLFKRALLCSSQ
jgi:predicted peptidase